MTAASEAAHDLSWRQPNPCMLSGHDLKQLRHPCMEWYASMYSSYRSIAVALLATTPHRSLQLRVHGCINAHTISHFVRMSAFLPGRQGNKWARHGQSAGQGLSRAPWAFLVRAWYCLHHTQPRRRRRYPITVKTMPLSAKSQHRHACLQAHTEPCPCLSINASAIHKLYQNLLWVAVISHI